MKIVRSARTGKFVDKEMAKRRPASTIVQERVRTSGLLWRKIATNASKLAGVDIAPAICMAAVAAHRSLTRSKKRR